MKNYLIAILGFLLLAGCASKTTPTGEPAPAVMNPTQSAPVPVTKNQTFYQSSSEFLAENLKKEGVKELPGGIQYRVIESGAGASPTLDDMVDVKFTATRVDGTEVSNSGATPRSYQVKKTMKELRRVLLEMKPGDRWEVVIPPSNRNKLTDHGGALIYDLELIAVQPANGKGS